MTMAESGGTTVSSSVLARIRAEYREMPGLCLTAAQAARLWGLPPGVCTALLRTLVDEGALTQTADVRYVAAAAPAIRRRGEMGEWNVRRGAA